MINVYIKGRLGNQMFQYAAARGVQEKFYPNEKINLNFKYVIKDGEKKKEKGWFNQLTGFKLNKSVTFDEKVKLSLNQWILVAYYFIAFKIIKIFSSEKNYYEKKKKFEDFIQSFYNKMGLYFFSYGYKEFKKTKRKNKLMIGYFESDKYFNNIKEKLIYEFTPKKDEKEENQNIYIKASNKDSVCISIRRGDFLDKENVNDCLICDEKYFLDSIKKIKEMKQKINLVVFSDDIGWVKNNIKFDCEDIIYESGKDDVWEKIRMMSKCNNFIISNSTFSWWIQYLSKNNKKIVIAPKKWRNNNVSLYKDMYNKDWILL